MQTLKTLPGERLNAFGNSDTTRTASYSCTWLVNSSILDLLAK